MRLSEAARAVWAKSSNGQSWLPLWRHMDDAAGVSAGLFDSWLGRSVVRLFAAEFDGDRAAARTVLTFLAGIHDLGKATPAFACQVEFLANRMLERGLYYDRRDLVDRHLAHHSVAGQHLLCAWLEGLGWSTPAAQTWAVVVGGHHGVPPDFHALRDSDPEIVRCLYGTGSWDEVRAELIAHVAAETGFVGLRERLCDTVLSARFQVLATAFVIVSDWVASNDELLPYLEDPLPAVSDDARRVTRALARLGLPASWQPQSARKGVDELFAARFELPPDAKPRPVQEAVVELVDTMAEPGLLVVEAPMGEGKTEAALAAAEILAARWGAGGVLVALPTQATTDAMFTRVLAWLDSMGSADQEVGGAIVLGHGKARFNRVYQGLFPNGRPSGIDQDAVGRHAVRVHAWLLGRKKALLANFAVVTIDQLLFAGLKARHLMLRHLALAGKVVVLDEIHAYDAFMNSYLTKVLTWLGAYGVPVVALSATLPAAQRRALVAAYQRGRLGVVDESSIPLGDEVGYPSLTWTSGETVATKEVSASGRKGSLRIDQLGDDLDDVVRVLREALADGGTALVVRNTVRRVLAAADRLEREFPGVVTVAHARFITADRLRKDADLLDAFGPPERARRPEWHIVVASQVVEQSLDVDFDLLVTDLAPIDLMLQRMGRVHRHRRGRPGRLRQPRVYVTGADFSCDPPELDPAAERYVYGSYPLLRSAAVLVDRFGGTVELPGDIVPLVQRAYGADAIGPSSWQDAIAEARTRWDERVARREAEADKFQVGEPVKQGKAIIGWLRANVGEADDDGRRGQGQVRDGAPSLEAMLVYEDAHGTWRTPHWLIDGAGGLPIPRDVTPEEGLAEVMASCAVRLPLAFSNADAEDELLEATPPRWEDSPLIYRQYALVVDMDGWGRLRGRRFRYTQARGLEVFDDDE